MTLAQAIDRYVSACRKIEKAWKVAGGGIIEPSVSRLREAAGRVARAFDEWRPTADPHAPLATISEQISHLQRGPATGPYDYCIDDVEWLRHYLGAAHLLLTIREDVPEPEAVTDATPSAPAPQPIEAKPRKGRPPGTTEDRDEAIERRLSDGIPQKNIAIEFSLSPARISQIKGELKRRPGR